MHIDPEKDDVSPFRWERAPSLLPQIDVGGGASEALRYQRVTTSHLTAGTLGGIQTHFLAFDMLLMLVFAAAYTAVADDPICTDRHDVVADFVDNGLFQRMLSNLQTPILYSGEKFRTFGRVSQSRPWNGAPIPMLHLRPRKSSSLIFELTQSNDTDFNSHPDGLPYTSIEFYAIAPEEHAKFHVKLFRDSVNESKGNTITWVYDAPDDKMHPVRVRLRGRLTKEAKAIAFTDFSSDGNYYIGKISLNRICSLHEIDFSSKADAHKSESPGRQSLLLWVLPLVVAAFIIIAVGAKVFIARKSKIQELRRGMNDALEKDDELRLNPWAHGNTTTTFDGY